MKKLLANSLNTKIVFITYFLLATVIVVLWFRDGKLLATGEDGLWLYEPTRTLKLFTGAWTSKGLGTISVFTLPRLPILGLASIFSFVFSSWIIQAIIYWSLILSGLFGMYLLVGESIQNKKWRVSFFAGMFYLLNLYTQSQIWRRFLSTSMFAWAYLPLFLFLWIKWAKTGKISWLIRLLISSILFSYTFSSPAFLFTFFLPVAIWFAINLFRSKKNASKLLTRGISGLFLWTIVNIWWIYPFISLADVSVSGTSGWRPSFDSLRGVSRYFPTSQILLLRQDFLFGPTSKLYDFYSNEMITYISVGILFVVLLGFFRSRKNKSWPYLFSLAAIGWFISKGANPPFGQKVFEWMFSSFPPSMLLRNSYEKFGLVWLIPYSVFFAIGLNGLYKNLKKNINKLALLFLVLPFVILVLPMWSGKVFSKEARVKVPGYYAEANDFLNRDESYSRLLILPLISGDGVHYDWGNSLYSGIEPSEYLFDKPSVSKILRSNRYADQKYGELNKALIEGEDYSSLLTEMNIKYIVFHDDLSFKIITQEDTVKIKSKLLKRGDIEFLAEFGELSIFEFLGNSEPKHILVEGGEAPAITYKKNSNSSYLVRVENATAPYSLLLKESFSDRWKAKVESQGSAKHFLANGYANGWKIDRLGSYNIELVFKVWPWE